MPWIIPGTAYLRSYRYRYRYQVSDTCCCNGCCHYFSRLWSGASGGAPKPWEEPREALSFQGNRNVPNTEGQNAFRNAFRTPYLSTRNRLYDRIALRTYFIHVVRLHHSTPPSMMPRTRAEVRRGQSKEVSILRDRRVAPARNFLSFMYVCKELWPSYIHVPTIPNKYVRAVD